MVNDSVNPNHIGDDSVAAMRMTRQSPPSLVPKTAHRTPLGHRFQRALTGGPNGRLPGLHPAPGGAASLSPFFNRRLVLPILAILSLLARQPTVPAARRTGLGAGRRDDPIPRERDGRRGHLYGNRPRG